MLTRCPHCLSWFRIRAEHLSIAGGQVTCGECDAVFDALASLVEEREGTAPGEPIGAPPAPPSISADDSSNRDDALPVTHPPHSLSADEHAILFTEPGAEDRLEDTVPEARAVVDALYGDLAPPAAPRGLPWLALAVLLALVLMLQFAWQARTQVERWIPASAALYLSLCARLDCPSVPAPPSIRLVARDVREHPQYRDALLVNATLINDAATPQPFPIIELRLHDAAGRVLGARRFAPAEYLDQSIAIGDGMPPARPVYIVMELGGDAATAASFEFTFM